VFVDVLSPCVILLKVMQYDRLDILAVLSSLLRSIKETEKFSSTPIGQWPTYAMTIHKCTTTDGSESTSTVYQSLRLKQFDAAKSHFANHCASYCSKVCDCIKSRLAWTDLDMLRDIIFVLASQGWQKVVDEEEDLGAIDRLAEHFRLPLEKAGTMID